jgi:hypothetical protein
MGVRQCGAVSPNRQINDVICRRDDVGAANELAGHREHSAVDETGAAQE